MKPGDLVTLLNDVNSTTCLKLWGEPRIFLPDFDAQFFPNDIGIVLEKRDIANSRNTKISWIKLLCPSGVGWTYESVLHLLHSF